MSDLIFEFLLLTCQYLKPLGLPPPPPRSGKMDGQGQAFLGCSPVHLQKLYLMSFLTEHCSTDTIQSLFYTAVFEHQLHSCLFPGKGDLLICELSE